MVSTSRLWEMFLDSSGQAWGRHSTSDRISRDHVVLTLFTVPRKYKEAQATKGHQRNLSCTRLRQYIKEGKPKQPDLNASLIKRWAFRLFITTPISHNMHPFFSSMDGKSCSVNVTERESDPWVRKIHFLVSQIETSKRECHSGDWLLCFCKQELSFTKFQVSLVKKEDADFMQYFCGYYMKLPKHSF